MATSYVPDLSLTSAELVVALINHDNGLQLTLNEIRISGTVTNPSPTTSRRNTITEISKIRKPDGASVVVYYDRLDADEVLTYEPILISLDGTEANIRDILSVVNEFCGTNLQPEDLRASDITLGNDPISVNVADDSPAWMNAFMVTLFDTTERALANEEDAIFCIGDDAVLTFEVPDGDSAEENPVT
ncbi:hypothetical protein DAV47_18275 [Salmonella enterica subsp. enterica serovar Enteritidis]|nr:hypothetical protein [Salmonella enterica subsp. enterica serovar Enteritidis]